MLNQLFTTKLNMAQAFVDGKRVPVTVLSLPTQVVTQLKNDTKDGYTAVQVAIGKKSRPSNKPQSSHLKQAKLDYQPRWIREVRFSLQGDQQPALELGAALPISDILAPGDLINVAGTTIGKGFAGVVKRHGFAGGPRTHGQSDRLRAPGSIGRGTTPGRVLPGKKMAGHLGNITDTVKNLRVVDIDLDNHSLTVSGPVPGPRGSLLRLTVVKKAPTNSSAAA